MREKRLQLGEEPVAVRRTDGRQPLFLADRRRKLRRALDARQIAEIGERELQLGGPLVISTGRQGIERECGMIVQVPAREVPGAHLAPFWKAPGPQGRTDRGETGTAPQGEQIDTVDVAQSPGHALAADGDVAIRIEMQLRERCMTDRDACPARHTSQRLDQRVRRRHRVPDATLAAPPQ